MQTDKELPSEIELEINAIVRNFTEGYSHPLTVRVDLVNLFKKYLQKESPCMGWVKASENALVKSMGVVNKVAVRKLILGRIVYGSGYFVRCTPLVFKYQIGRRYYCDFDVEYLLEPTQDK